MKRPRWLSVLGKGKNHFEGSLLVDASDVKVVEANFEKELAFLAIGTLQRCNTGLTNNNGNRDLSMSCDNSGDWEWKIFYDSTLFANLEGNDHARKCVAGIVTLVSGITSVYDAGTVYVKKGKRPSKGNSPILLDFDLAGRIERAKGKT